MPKQRPKQRREQKEPPRQLATPTPEQIAKGGYERPTGRGTVAVYTNRHNTLLMRLRAYKTISGRQYQAGLAFEASYEIAWGSLTPCRDRTRPPVGGISHETETQAERIGRARARLNTILNRVEHRVYSLLRAVIIHGEGFGGRDRGRLRARYDDLRRGLNECAEVYGISDDGD